MPSVASTAIDMVTCKITPITLLVKAVENLSIIFLAGNDLSLLESTLDCLMNRFSASSTEEQLSLLTAVRKMLANLFRDLPRLWQLEELSLDERFSEAKTMFVVEETAIQACHVDTKATLEMILEFLNAMLWGPLLDKPCAEEYSLLMWTKAVNIWSLVRIYGDSVRWFTL